MEIVISGASGLIGTALTEALQARGDRPVRLVRRPVVGRDEIYWDVTNGQLDAESLHGADAVVHLAGAGIGDKRWSDTYKETLLTSRTESTHLLSTRLAALDKQPRCFLSGSAIGFYGNRGVEVLDETSSAGDGFLTELCTQWEASTLAAREAGITTTYLRTGIVLTPDGGALAKMLPLFKLGLGGSFGRGAQMMSWISLADEVRAILHLIDNPITGPVNLTAPSPVSNKDFSTSLGAALGRPTFLTVPPFGPRLVLGRELADALLFDGADIRPAALLASGYAFEHPTIDECFSSIL